MADMFTGNADEVMSSIIEESGALSSAQLTALIRKLMAERDSLRKKELQAGKRKARQMPFGKKSRMPIYSK